MNKNKLSCPFTGETEARKVFVYSEPPHGEIKFKTVKDQAYYREIWQFPLSRHYLSVHQMDLSDLYEGAYVDANYQNKSGLRKTFDRIIGLPHDRSDNVGRIDHITNFLRSLTHRTSCNTLLDVGSGLGVFPFGMKLAGWECTSIDPDLRSVEHIQSLGIEAQQGDFMNYASDNVYPLITFNKVLEHVLNPVIMLQKCKGNLTPAGLVYVEVPDGEMAEAGGPEREEFCVDHHHIFSATSLSMLADQAGFSVLQIQRLQEPSTKYTLRAFLKPHY
jgi:SAM-dependent methyltransferase